VLPVGSKVQVQISEIDPRGKLSLVPVLDEAAASDDATGDTSD
jgi:polyribonucleotide nucleotidyltransferase